MTREGPRRVPLPAVRRPVDQPRALRDRRVGDQADPGRGRAEVHHPPGQPKAGATLTIAMVDPTNVFAMDDIKFMTGYNVEPVVASRDRASARRSTSTTARTHAIELKKVMDETWPRPTADATSRCSRKKRSSTSTTLEAAVRGGAGRQAGQHHPHRRDQEGRLRHPHRALREGLPRPLPHRRRALRDDAPAAEAAEAITSRIKIMAKLDIAEKRLPQDGRIKIKIKLAGQDQGAGLPRLGAADALRREDRAAAARQGQPDARHDQAGLRGRVAAQVRAGDPQALRHGAGHRTDRLGQDEHALLGAARGSTRPRPTS